MVCCTATQLVGSKEGSHKSAKGSHELTPYLDHLIVFHALSSIVCFLYWWMHGYFTKDIISLSKVCACVWCHGSSSCLHRVVCVYVCCTTVGPNGPTSDLVAPIGMSELEWFPDAKVGVVAVAAVLVASSCCCGGIVVTICTPPFGIMLVVVKLAPVSYKKLA